LESDSRIRTRQWNCFINLSDTNEILRSIKISSILYKTENWGIQKYLHINSLNWDITYTDIYSTKSYKLMMTKHPELALPCKTKRNRKKLGAFFSYVRFVVGKCNGVARGRQKNWNEIKSARNLANTTNLEHFFLYVNFYSLYVSGNYVPIITTKHLYQCDT
jgi:hypothetical protein